VLFSILNVPYPNDISILQRLLGFGYHSENVLSTSQLDDAKISLLLLTRVFTVRAFTLDFTMFSSNWLKTSEKISIEYTYFIRCK